MTLISKLKQHVHDLDEWSRLPSGKTQKPKYNIILAQDAVLVKQKTLYMGLGRMQRDNAEEIEVECFMSIKE